MKMTDGPVTGGESSETLGDRVLMLAPTARDAAMAENILRESGCAVEVFQSYGSLAEAMEQGAGTLILMEEFFASADAPRLLKILEQQPAWSSLSLIVLAGGRSRHVKSEPVLKSFANVVLLERPARIAPLLSAVRAALAARERQYELRDIIEEMKRSAEERDQLYRETERARAEAEAANRMKDDFLATLSHELRTPLNAIVGWAKVLRLGASGEQDLEEGLLAIERNSKVQAQLIEDLLDIYCSRLKLRPSAENTR